MVASGGVYSEGSPIADRNFAPQYLKLIMSVIGITDVDVIHGEGAKAVDLGERTMSDFVAGHVGQMKQLAHT